MHNEENIVVSNAPELVSAFTRQFDDLWNAFSSSRRRT